MISFQEYLTENAPFHSNSGIKAFFTNHSLERKVLRAEVMALDDFKVLIDRVIKWIKANGRMTLHNEEFLAYSKSMRQGIIFAYRRDRFDKEDQTKHVYIMTVLPKGRSNPKPGTPKVVVESYIKEDHNWSEDFLGYVQELIGEKTLMEAVNSDAIVTENIGGMNVFLVDGKLFETEFEVIEVA